MIKLRYANDLGARFLEARRQINHLQELKRWRDIVVNMDRGTVSEVANYPAPPMLVKKVMTSTFMLLGDSRKQASVSLFVRLCVCEFVGLFFCVYLQVCVSFVYLRV